MKNLKSKINNLVFGVKGYLEKQIKKCMLTLANNNGESESTGNVVLIIAAIVVGAVLITLVVVMFKDTLWPLVTEKIKALFNI